MIVLNTVTEPTENVRLVQPQVALYVENHSHGQGKLIVSESSVAWISSDNLKGFTLTYPSIVLHAISRDLSSFPEECLYLLVDASQGDLVLTPNQPQEPDSDGEMDDDQMDHVTLRFVPIDKSILDNAYKQMCYCQELNPCSDMSDEEVDYDEEPVGDMPGASSGVVFNDFGGGFEDAGVQWYGEGTNPDDVQLSSEGMVNLQRILGGGVQSDKEDENGDHQMEE